MDHLLYKTKREQGSPCLSCQQQKSPAAPSSLYLSFVIVLCCGSQRNTWLLRPPFNCSISQALWRIQKRDRSLLESACQWVLLAVLAVTCWWITCIKSSTPPPWIKLHGRTHEQQRVTRDNAINLKFYHTNGHQVWFTFQQTTGSLFPYTSSGK